ncbi:superoxide dismutase family protein [Ponticaulis sp.]|uniref:superoxide dismutase family protein n=1 Tax=Ponticaulis sp. TaxID=2020902 RepID=UPI000B7319DD|nr:superoxide dismutase family protein [Ponticaulis sp.]OUX99734.1 MAG: hypothetical protein CBB65_06530 [Hyphomonadaceae bacterium TMED5]|tara:strand:- start:36450 stop:37046 length:597 start_codon:yes stop_codon:yes gene_type:complete
MRLVLSATALSTAILFAACSPAETQEAEPAPEPTPEVTETALPETTESIPSMMNAGGTLIGSEGSEIGDINIIEGPNGLLLRITVEPGSLEPGWHGLHMHQVGDCSDVGTFTNSGGHVGKIEGGHGLLNPAGPEGGDIPNIWVAADGSAGYEAFTSLTTGAELINEDGGAIIIHAMEDDHMSQPIGGAGPRVACGVVN